MKRTPTPATAFPLRILYDGACPLCHLEMHKLKARDRSARLHLIDIADPHFDPAPWGASLANLNAVIHAVDAQGHTHRGVAALRLAYEAVGLGWVLRLSTWPLLAPAFDAAYRMFARHRQASSRALGPLLARLLDRPGRSDAQAPPVCGEGACRRGHVEGERS